MYQRKYVKDVLSRFQMLECKPIVVSVEGKVGLIDKEAENPVDPTLFRQMVGCLRFICHSRPEISYDAGVISRHMANPRQSYMIAAKRIMRYLKGTMNFGILFPNQKEVNESCFVGYLDSDWFGDKEDRKSTYRCVFSIFGAPV
ncbi:PREDICTED: uncharacterized protein LOC109358001 [Lupinus angustifolius]|uniref:uncharacterized protein LOC109358001 n=1 Tax=Lupinus angustifolius TaxID=3871 RepID=UPI00092EB13F|nr:PREDICTED: uncharacterized protein LOC109358001 [Lupinus angustifolius]